MGCIASTRYVLALDQGGSKCEGLLVREDGTVRRAGRAQQPGLSGRSLEAIVATIRQLLPARPTGRLHLALLGCTDETRTTLTRQTGAAQIHLMDELDSSLALQGANCGIVVVAGTGARVSARTRGGRFLTLDGLGPVLGDVGSGYQIGRLALRAAARAAWHPRHRTGLRDRIFDACGKLSPARPIPGQRLHGLIHFSLCPHDRSVIASLARLVNAKAEAGDRVAIDILYEAADGIAETVHDVVDRLRIRGDSYLLIGTGSVAMHSDIYWRRLCRQVKKFAPKLSPRRSPYPPVVGVALCTLLRLNGSDPAGVRRRLFDSFENYQRTHEHSE